MSSTSKVNVQAAEPQIRFVDAETGKELEDSRASASSGVGASASSFKGGYSSFGGGVLGELAPRTPEVSIRKTLSSFEKDKPVTNRVSARITERVTRVTVGASKSKARGSAVR